jgi:uncharacterized protein YgfB (UPF0149 family)
MNDFSQNFENLYESFDEVLAEADCEINASEFQGILAGMISAGLKSTDKHWQSVILDVANDGHALSADALSEVKKVFAESLFAFTDQEILAPILLPDDEYPLIDRMEAMSFWCQGFLLGFGLQLGKQSIDNSDIAESLQDISEISQLELSLDESQEAQLALVTLIEHMKVAVKVIYMELVIKKELNDANSVDGNDTYH